MAFIALFSRLFNRIRRFRSNQRALRLQVQFGSVLVFSSFVFLLAEHSGEHTGNFDNVIVSAGATVDSANVNNAFLRRGSSSYFDFANEIRYETGN